VRKVIRGITNKSQELLEETAEKQLGIIVVRETKQNK
jgi:hypothetical protein